jgi:DNA (cytosine-5)-methyltransferase 1
VSSAIGHGWLDGVFDDLEGEGYTCGAVVLPACSVGAPHIRQRLFWVAVGELGNANGARQRARWRPERCEREGEGQSVPALAGSAVDPGLGGLGEPYGAGSFEGQSTAADDGHGSSAEPAGCGPWSDFRIVVCRDIDKRTGQHALRRVPIEPAFFPVAPRVPGRVDQLRGIGNSIVPQVAATFVRAFMEVLHA